MNLILAYTKIYSLELIRNRTAAFFTLLFPSLLMLMIGMQHGNQSTALLASIIIFCNYSVQTIAFQVLGMNISVSRNSDWSIYLRALPVTPIYMFAGRILSMFIFIAASMSLIILINITRQQIELAFSEWLIIIIVAFCGGIPMALLGIAVGYWVNASAARAAFVLINLGLLFSAFSFPNEGLLTYVRDTMLTYEWMMASFNFLTGSFSIVPWLWLLGYTIVFYFLALMAYRHKRNLRFE